MGKNNAIWNPPPCFPEVCVNATMIELASRYGVHKGTIAKHITRLPATVQEARNVVVRKRRLEAGLKGVRSANRVADFKRSQGLPVRQCRDPVEIGERIIRKATRDFEAHYCEVAERHEGWPIRGYSA